MKKSLIIFSIVLLLISLSFVSAQIETKKANKPISLLAGESADLAENLGVEVGAIKKDKAIIFFNINGKLEKKGFIDGDEFSVKGKTYIIETKKRFLFWGNKIKITPKTEEVEEVLEEEIIECVADEDCGEGGICNVDEGICERVVSEEGFEEEISGEEFVEGEMPLEDEFFVEGGVEFEEFGEFGDEWAFGDEFAGDLGGEVECYDNIDCEEGFICSIDGFCEEEFVEGETGFGEEEILTYREGDIIELAGGEIEILEITNNEITFTLTSIDGTTGEFTAGEGEAVSTNLAEISVGTLSGGGIFGGGSAEIFIDESGSQIMGSSSTEINFIDVMTTLSSQNSVFNGLSAVQKTFLIRSLPVSCIGVEVSEEELAPPQEEEPTPTPDAGSGELSGGISVGPTPIGSGTFGGGTLSRIFVFPISGLAVSQGRSSCSDTDGGKNSLAFGIAGDESSCLIDSCASDKSVLESFCERGEAVSDEVNCPSWASCFEGVCISDRILPSIQGRKITGSLTPVQSGTISAGSVSVSGGSTPVLGTGPSSGISGV